jgi:sugar lactone lactonase YvrE
VGSLCRALASLAGKANSYGNNNALGEDARFGLLRGLAFNPSGDLFVIDYESYGSTSTTRLDPEIRRISPNGLVTSFAGSWQARYSYANGIGSGIAMDGIRAMTFDAAGNMYFGDGRTVRIISTGVSSSTIAGSLSASGYVNGQAQSARFSDIQGIARDSQGNLFVSDTGNHAIRKVSTAGVVTTFAGADSAVASHQRSGYSDGIGIAARFRSPSQIAIDAADNLYVADAGNHRIRRISPAGVVTTLAGQSDADVVDGQGTSAKFDNPFAMAIDISSGNLYVSDWNGCTVRRVTPTGDVTTVVGAPYNCGVFFGSLPAGVASVGGLAVRNGRLYIASLNGIYWTNLP